MKDNFDDVDGFIRELVRSTLWNIGYRERKLVDDSRLMKVAKEMVDAAGFDFQAMVDNEADADLYEGNFESLESMCHAMVQDRIDSVKRDEEELQKAYKQMAMVKVLLVRGNFVVDIADIQRDVDASLDKRP